MVLTVKISMNVRTIHTTVMLMASAPIQTARFTAHAKSVILAMESTVQTWKSAAWAHIIAISMLHAPIQKDHLPATAIEATMVLDINA